MNNSHQKGLSWPLVLFAVVLLLIIGGLILPSFLFNFTRGHGGPLTRAANNAKVIASGLNMFRQEYGSYPCEATREELIKKGEDRLPVGASANAYLAQLVVTGIIDSETYFYAAEIDGFQKGDDIKNSGELLKKGENSFLYLMGQDGKSLNVDISITPLVMAAVEKRGRHPKFNTEIYGGRYVYGAVDGSSIQGELSEDGTPMLKGRAHLFETGPDSLFGEDIPTFTYPLGL